MYREHPLRILRYSAKYIWLLVFPLIRGIYAATLDFDKLYVWFRGAWFDFVVVCVIILFGLAQWLSSRVIIRDDAIIHSEGIILKINRIIPFENISSFSTELPIFLRPLGCIRIYCDTCAGIFRSSDMKLLVSRKVCNQIRKKIPRLKENEVQRHKPSMLTIVLLSAFFSSGFTGLVYIATLFIKGGSIARDILNLSIERITEETLKLQSMNLLKIPSAVIGIGAFFIAAWVLSFVFNILRYYGFKVEADHSRLRISCGIFTRRVFSINASFVNYTDLRQSLIMKFFRIVTVNINCAGYGSGNKHLPVLIPVRKQKKNDKKMLFGLFDMTENAFKPTVLSFFHYTWAPLILFVAILLSVCFIPALFPQTSELVKFTLIMAEIPTGWLLLVKIAALFTSGVYLPDDKIIVKYSSFFSFHTIVSERYRLVKISIRQSPFQRLSKRCTIGFYFNGEVSKRHFVRDIKCTEAENILSMLGNIPII